MREGSEDTVFPPHTPKCHAGEEKGEEKRAGISLKLFNWTKI